MKLDQDGIKKIIPHREPMLLVTTVEDLEPGVRIAATFRTDTHEGLFEGHYPEAPMLPGVYTVESIAQAACIVLLSVERYAGKVPLLLQIDRFRFLRKILPGETMEVRAALVKERAEKAIVSCSAEVYVNGELAADGEVTLAVR